jgi:hypothetical protein
VNTVLNVSFEGFRSLELAAVKTSEIKTFMVCEPGVAVNDGASVRPSSCNGNRFKPVKGVVAMAPLSTL